MKLWHIFRDLFKLTETQEGPSALRPIDQGIVIVIEGDPNHRHRFEEAKWNRERDGSDITSVDKDPGGEVAFPKATFKTLLHCSCGREGIHSARALI